MHYVYILKSVKDQKLYVGCTSDINRRLDEHNRGCVRSTKSRRPFEIVHTEEFFSKKEAILRERFLKYTPEGGILKKHLASVAGNQ